MALNPRQQRFAAEYIIDFNATAAYQRAGYKAAGHAAEVNASRLLSNAEVQAAIKVGMEALAKRTELTQDWIVERLKENAARAAQAVPVFDREGSPTGEYTYQGSVVNRALELLGKHKGMFVDRHEVTGKNGAPIPVATTHAIDLTKLTAEQLAQLEGILSAITGGSKVGAVPA
jgi:phage terminase small subunit